MIQLELMPRSQEAFRFPVVPVLTPTSTSLATGNKNHLKHGKIIFNDLVEGYRPFTILGGDTPLFWPRMLTLNRKHAPVRPSSRTLHWDPDGALLSKMRHTCSIYLRHLTKLRYISIGFFVTRHLTTDMQISHCVGFAAMWNANSKKSEGLRATGIGAVVCARHAAYRPNGMGDLQKGER